ncbi:heterokaryon incompatibility, partial [Pyrenochaeta sp. DS3sAY3a]
RYLALSYAWGNSSDRRPVVINNHEHYVTTNLEDFLRVWRQKAVQERDQPLADFYLWIDAICINQDDLLERKSQVMLMSEIYPKAK